ncbi:TonB family protein [Aestuariivirga sp.]|uniref:TonB family protein n=1 Tax=Aestuariivirga sp. TaxID=2650926 RepID=UPI003BAAA3A1
MTFWRGLPASIIVHAAAATIVFASIAEGEHVIEDVASMPTELILEIDSSPVLERPAVEEDASAKEPAEVPAPPLSPPPLEQRPVVQPQPAVETPEVTAALGAEPVVVPPPVEKIEKFPPNLQQPLPKAEKPAPKRERAVTLRKKSVKQKAALAAGKGSDGKIRTTDGKALEQSYKSKILARLRSAKRYPDAARRKGLEGTAVLSFTIDAAGRLTAARISTRSGAPAIDDAALAMARNAAPFPPFPPGLARQQMTFRVPVQFAID